MPDIVAEASTGREALLATQLLKPDIVLMDVSMPKLNGVEATRRIVAERTRTRVIGLSMHSDPRYVLAMLDAGAAGFLLKDAASTELIEALRQVASGRSYASEAVSWVVVGGLFGPQRPSQRLRLTPREREVLQLLSEGKASKEIASHLAVAVTTIETHRRKIMDKLNLRSTAELTKFAIREGLTSLEA